MNSLFTKLYWLTLGLLALLTGCQESRPKNVASTAPLLRSMPFRMDTSARALYVIELWKADAQQPDGLPKQVPPIVQAGIKQQVLIRARDGAELVRLSSWASEADAVRFARNASQAGPHHVLTSRLVNYATRPPGRYELDSSSSVMYSEFIMKRKSAQDTLSAIAKGMTTAMAQIQPTLDFVLTANSTDSSTITLFGVWNTREGFEVFAKQKTWGEAPYWEPYADNDHHMFDVVYSLGIP